ncbi:MAG: branched-chain amino acid ABC transporter ATP-binding protein [Alphaproteobacteria bacterium HGW-Alphaproteobacteria-6]|nr:MAG: branched-chain amino acid ABC transporter ATP-binding protein [Alphaproteobacteria bacterium HGW-Alphaproteobacteria-6]
MLLSVRSIEVNYGQVRAVRGVSLEVDDAQVVTLIGSNGAGKSTTLRTISGLNRPSKGEIWFDGERIDQLAPVEIVKRGIAHVPEGRHVFANLTVLQNLYTGGYLSRDKARLNTILEQIYEYFPVLAQRRDQRANTLSGGEQQMLAIGRMMMSSPRLILLDEPSLGLSPKMMKEISRIILTIRENGTPVVLVEQNAEMALRLANYGYVMETGKITLDGPADELRGNDHVRKAYLGI